MSCLVDFKTSIENNKRESYRETSPYQTESFLEQLKHTMNASFRDCAVIKALI